MKRYILFLLLTGCNYYEGTTPADYKHATERCEANGGLKSYYVHDVYYADYRSATLEIFCNNDATFYDVLEEDK